MASYARLPTTQIQAEQLRPVEIPDSQGAQFANAWRVIDQYNHSTEPYWTYDPNTGQPDGPFSESNGLSATVFQNVATGERVLAIRGTSDIHDVITDVVDVFTLGSTRNQGQYQTLRDKVQQWVADGVLPQHFPVTGHSLGGFLATGLALEFPQHVDHAYLYNTPGLGGLTSRPVLDEIARAYHIGGGSFDPSRFSNVRAKPGTSLISGFGTPLSAPILVEGEDARAVADALAALEQGLDFADALHLASSGGATRFVTFDRKLVRRARGAAKIEVVAA